MNLVSFWILKLAVKQCYQTGHLLHGVWKTQKSLIKLNLHPACRQSVLPDRSILKGQKLVENTQSLNFQCDILGDFQTMCCYLNLVSFWQLKLTVKQWYQTVEMRLTHIVQKSLKMSNFNFSTLSFSINFCHIKIGLSGNTVWHQASSFQKTSKSPVFGIFDFLSTEYVEFQFFNFVICHLFLSYQNWPVW